MSTKAKSDGLKVQVPTIPYEQTLRRLQKIQDHLSRPRSNRLKGKVCIVTGVGSLKGIGSVRELIDPHRHLTDKPSTVELQRCFLLTKVRGCQIRNH